MFVNQFVMKDLGEGSHILYIMLYARLEKSDVRLILNYLNRWDSDQVYHSKKWLFPFKYGVPLSKDLYPKTS